MIQSSEMDNLGCILVLAFGNCLVSVLVVANTISNLNLQQEDEGYESN